jgi:hypothetical protein
MPLMAVRQLKCVWSEYMLIYSEHDLCRRLPILLRKSAHEMVDRVEDGT